MNRPEDSGENGGRLDRVLLLFLVALFLFASPFTTWWAHANPPWYTPFLLWGLLIALLAFERQSSSPDDDDA